MLTVTTRLSKVQLEITDYDYVHRDDMKIYFAKIANIVSKAVDDDVLMNKILMEWAGVPEPKSGRRKKGK